MDTTPNIPQGSLELETFAAMLAAEASNLDVHAVGMVIAVHDPPDGIVSVSLQHDDPGGQARIDQLLADRRSSVVGALMPMAWSPDDSAMRPAWILVAVREAEPAVFAVRRVAEDDQWRRLPVSQMPWIVASTAASLRAALIHSRPLRFKRTTDPRMFRRPGDGDPPPTDESGRL